MSFFVKLIVFSCVILTVHSQNISQFCSKFPPMNYSLAGLRGIHSTIGLGYAILLILGFGLFAAIVATAFSLVRKYIYRDANSLDTAFDAGGKVSIGLTATTIVSQWTWSATLLQSATVASKYGISGSFWHAAGATIQIILFAILSIQLKTKAPGAKTFLQVIRARFGKRVHVVFCVFACLTNIVVTTMLLLGGIAVLVSLVKGLSIELALLITALVIGSYTLIGGLGATFYVSYFNTSLIFAMVIILIIAVFHNPGKDPNNPLGSASALYDHLICTKGPARNAEGSYLTFVSLDGLMFGIINIIGNFGTVFCDQSYWQSSIAAKPLQGVWGFISGGLTWFAIPFTMSTTTGLAYLALSVENGAPLLSTDNVNAGLVPPTVAQKLLGSTGEYVIVLLILMAVMSTGSAEVIAVSSIIIYDIYKIHINPFRRDLPDNACPLCALPPRDVSEKLSMASYCECRPISDCQACIQDTRNRHESKDSVLPAYTCTTHGKYRQYMDQLLNYKNWCIVLVTMSTIPLVYICQVAKLNLSWVYLFMGILIGPAVIPISLSVLWSRVSGKGMVIGVISGSICGLVSWLITIGVSEGGLHNFISNSSKEVPMLVGNCVSIGLGGVVCIIVSLITNRDFNKKKEALEWEKTRDINNPLVPWTQTYWKEFGLTQNCTSSERPSGDALAKIFKRAKWTANIFGIFISAVMIIVVPVTMITQYILKKHQFITWVYFAEIYAFIAAGFIVIVPLGQEIYGICKRYHKNKKLDQNPQKEPEANGMETVGNHHGECHDNQGFERVTDDGIF